MNFSLTLVLVFLIVSRSFAAEPASFQVAFDQFVHEDEIMGGSYVLLERGKVVESHNIGMADVAEKQPVNDDTIFHWASITKTLTAVAMMQLRDHGKLSLDDPILKYVPELSRVHSENNAVAKVTLRHLLSHTAGFQSPTWPYTEGKPWQPFEPTEWSQLVAMMPYQELSFEPGTRFQYSNPGFIYLARVIESITGEPYQVYVQKNILTPLGMTRSFYNISPYHLAKDRSNSYVNHLEENGHVESQPLEREFDTGITAPNGGLNAPLSDMAKWISFLAGATPASVSDLILARKSVEEMWRPIASVPTDAAFSGAKSVSLSFFQYSRGGDDQTFIGHTGHQAGFAAFFLLNPRTGRAVIGNFNTVWEETGSEAEKKRYHESQQRFTSLMQRAMDAIR